MTRSVPSRAQEIPVFRIGVGIVLLLLWVGVSAFSLLTTQDLFKGGDGSGVRPDWSVLTQLWGLVHGEYQGITVVAILGSWAIFIVYLIFSYAEIMEQDGTGKDRAFRTICMLIMILDGYANWRYLHILPAEYQWIMTFLMFIVIVYCGKMGINIILSAISEMAEP